MRDLRGIALAGGSVEHLKPLPTMSAKPVVSFGGKYRAIDFVLNNFLTPSL
jgi:glucose-1-phosphate adenylyltransferase